VTACNNIDKCSVMPRKGSPNYLTSPMQLETSGVNFELFWNLDDYLSINEIKSNDIHAMLKTYGV